MSDQSIFGNENNSQVTPAQPNQPNGGQPQLDQVMTLLAGIRNESGEQKYKTIEDAVKALAHSQSFIPTLQNESRQKDQLIEDLKQKVQKVDTLESTLQELVQRQSNTPTKVQEIDEDKIAELVNSSLQRSQRQAIAQENTKKVTDKMLELFGDKASETFYSKAEAEGLSKSEINDLAAKSPSLVFKLFGIDAQPVNNAGVNRSTVNTAGFKPNQDPVLTRNKESVLIGATTQQVVQESQLSRKLVDELHSKGLTTYDLTDPKVYKQYFG